ncbi:MAG TPA: SRPBCC domain-containing protein [Arachnia sp.]|nr:SRPBCC domain-containing protein [Arachnia sp.]HMT86098.1 SRPBCC domain-containing protein [Arachnia sp.]
MDMNSRSESPQIENATTVERPSDREVVVTRSFNAARDLVFRAWSDPELFRRWWVPKSMEMTLYACEMDVRTGGSYRLNFGEGLDFFGTYLEVTPPSRLVWTNAEGGENASITTVTLTETDGKTLVVVSELYPSKEALRAEGGAEDALDETFAQLEELLVELAS